MKINRKQLSQLIKEEYQRQLRLEELKKQKKAIEKELNELFGRESGFFPPGTEFDPNAPWNQKDPEMIPCTHCNGTGKDPIDGQDCVVCDGTGEVEDDSDPSDIDNMDEFEPDDF